MTGHDLIITAIRDLGYHEGKNKQNKFGAWYGWNNVAWCMQAVQYWYAMSGNPLPFKTASCGELLNYYKKNDPDCIVKDPVEGCIVIFNFPGGSPTDHTGLFVSKTDSTITTIDGNTSGLNQSNGGWVSQRTRPLSYANPTYIKPRELEEPKEEQLEEQEMRYNKLSEIPKWAQPTIEKLLRNGYLNGSGTTKDENGFPADLDLSIDMIRTFVVLDRAKLY